MLTGFHNRIRIVGQAIGPDQAVSVVDSLDPDVVLCDIRMQGSSGLDLCRTLRQRDPHRKVVMLSVYDDEQYLFQALRVGVDICSRASAVKTSCANSSGYATARRRSIPPWPLGRWTPPPACSATNSVARGMV
ncbi:hypothetical protein MAGR_66830 [Mycolicibacterium agri]|uniref:Response regulatory domain-containing protein n=1 Tax=Mycolicibacterium agri TaxID=36811 RepID=A0A7I9WBY4_MYCAG|nr:hypothetical protein MAGR_66830 [Mycolicibacterium agri]